MFRPIVAAGIIRATAVNTNHQTPYMRVTTRAHVLVVCVNRGRVRME